jgi:seryl-tRNA(Sec) selenium transferase
MQRRTWLKWAAAAPVYAAMAARGVTGAVAAAVGDSAGGDVYRRLGVRPFINARGTWTYLSGSLELPEVRRAMDDAARHFVDIFELQQAAGRKLAQLSGAESGMVTSGAAGAMAAATAGCMAGTDPNKVWQLPDTTGMKNEVVMLGGRSAFDSAIRLTGAKLVVVGSVDDLPRGLNDRTAMVYTTWLGEQLQAALAVTKKAGVPLMLDDAAGIPPIENLTSYASMGIDLFCFPVARGCAGPSVREFCLEGRT